MKKILLSIVFALISLVTAYAAQLNPFAYGLSSSLSADQKTLTVRYSLNATATGVDVVVYNGENAVKTVSSDYKSKGGPYTMDIPTNGLPIGANLTWKVVVKGVSVQSPTLYDKTYAFYHPSAVDIDNNPENETFGLILTNEAMQEITSLTASEKGAAGISYSEYRSYTLGAGVYAFNPAFEPIVNGKKPGFNGGNEFTQYRKHNSTASGNAKVTAYAPRRIRISKDGRIFVTSLNTNGDVLWEIDPTNLDSWTPVFQGLTQGQYQDLYNGSTFVAGPNAGFDVRGSGKDLKLLMLSANTLTDQLAQRGFRISEYHLGEKTIWSEAPSKTFPHDNTYNSTQQYYQCYFIVPTQSQVQYDKDGGVWYISFTTKSSNSQPGLVHFTANGEQDYKKNWNNVRNGGFRFNHDFSKVIIAGNNVNGSSGETKMSTVYSVSKDAKGAPVLSDGVVIDMSILGNNLNDFAWDYAGNLYGVSNSNEKIAAWAMPYSGTVTTPAASKYAFSITTTNYGDPQLAPFAYDLRKTIECDGRTKLHFMLNAHAREVKVFLKDEEAGTEYLLRSYPNEYSETDYVPYHPNGYGTVITTEDVEQLGLSYEKNYSWRVDVYGEDVANPTCIRYYNLYHPTAVDIDNNPQNSTFGMVLANEGQMVANGSFEYLSTGFGAGIFAFDPAFNLIKNGVKKGFNGGIDFPAGRADDKSKVAYVPRRIRISENGRIFVTSLNTDGTYLWEVNPQNLDEWTPVFEYATLNNKKEILTSDGKFIAAPNVGFDVKGKGDDLKLLMLSSTLNGFPPTYASLAFTCHEYSIGSKTEWNTEPKEIFSQYAINYTGTQVLYDNEGGLWMCQYRGDATKTNPSLMHFNSSGVIDYTETINNREAGGIRFSKDFNKIIIAGDGLGTANPKKATIYALSKDKDGKPVLTQERVVSMEVVGTNFNDFAWDYAGNLYACGNEGEKVAVYVMPRSKNDVVSTPARDEYVVNLKQPVPCIVAYNLTYTPNGAKKTYDFSFYANTKPTSGTICFYKNNNTKDLLYTQDIASPKKGTNTVSIPMATLDEKLNLECDVIWEIELSAPSSEVFGKIYQSDPLNTAYATIDVNPESDYFGQIYATNQEIHTFAAGENGTLKGEICVWAPDGANGEIYHTIKENYKLGINLVGRLCVAPDGKLYISDNGRHGGLYVMDPKDYSTVSFFEGCTQGERSRWFAGDKHVGAPSSCPNIYWTGENTAQLFVTRTEYHTETNIGSQGLTADRHNEGYFVYPLAKNGNGWSKDWNNIQTVDITEDNLYQNDFSIVGTSHGAWLCQHRYNEMDVFEARSLMFYDKNGARQYCSDDNDAILGSAGAAVAINKEETRLAMSSGNGGIMFFSIDWSGDKPTLKHEYTSPLNNNYVVTSLNFDYAGNLVATVGDSYNDNTDRHRMIVFTTPKADNTVVVPARFSQRMAAIYADERNPVHIDNDVVQAYQTADVYRPLVAGMCNTICLPFAIADKAGTPYENAKIFSFVGVVEGNDQLELQFTEVTSMQAGVPYLIQPESDITDIVRFTNVAPMVGTEPSSVSWGNGVTFHGTINPKDLAVDANYLFLVANNRLATASEGGEMLGLRGYFTVNETLPSKAIISFREGTATGVTSTIGQTDSVQKILQNQQILIIKGGKTYTILGTRIR